MKKKRIISLLMSVMLFASIFVISETKVDAQRVADFYVYNCNTCVSLRKSRSTSSKVICTIPYGTKVTWCYGGDDLSKGFRKISYKGKVGYVLDKNLKVDYAPKKYKVNCNTYLTLRKSPSSRSTALKKVPKGATVYYEVSSQNGYARVNYQGKLGYVLKKYLKIIHTNYDIKAINKKYSSGYSDYTTQILLGSSSLTMKGKFCLYQAGSSKVLSTEKSRTMTISPNCKYYYGEGRISAKTARSYVKQAGNNCFIGVIVSVRNGKVVEFSLVS
ncbi:MAG: SH3 domain-containing protein [Lachnospiraceae bacterium]